MTDPREGETETTMPSPKRGGLRIRDERDNEKLDYHLLGEKPVSMDICNASSPFCFSDETIMNRIFGGEPLTRLSAVADGEGHEIVIKTNPILVVTNFRGRQDWMQGCICKSPCDAALPHCKRICFYSGVETQQNEICDVWVVTYTVLVEHRAYLANSRRWRVVILDYAATIPQPFSNTVAAVLDLECADWITVNRSGDMGIFNTSWKDLSRLAVLRSYGFGGGLIAEQFWKYSEPGSPAGPMTDMEYLKSINAGLYHLLEVLVQSKRDAPSFSKPAMLHWNQSNPRDGVWAVLATPDSVDARRLNHINSLLEAEHIYRGTDGFYCKPQHLDLSRVVKSQCAVCPRAGAEVFMLCCGSWIHCACLQAEAQQFEACPKCRTRFSVNSPNSVAHELLTKGSGEVVLLDPTGEREMEVHDWSVPSTPLTISRMLAERCTAGECVYEFRCVPSGVDTVWLTEPDACSCVLSAPAAAGEKITVWFLPPTVKVADVDAAGAHVLVFLDLNPPAQIAERWAPELATPARYRLRLLG